MTYITYRTYRSYIIYITYITYMTHITYVTRDGCWLGWLLINLKSKFFPTVINQNICLNRALAEY